MGPRDQGQTDLECLVAGLVGRQVLLLDGRQRVDSLGHQLAYPFPFDVPRIGLLLTHIRMHMLEVLVHKVTPAIPNITDNLFDILGFDFDPRVILILIGILRVLTFL